MCAIEKMEDLVRRYSSRRDAQGNAHTLAEDIRMSSLEALLSDDLEKHVQLNRARLNSYGVLREEIKTCCECRGHANARNMKQKGSSHLTRHIFSCFTAHISMSHVTLAQSVLRARHPCIIRMLLLSWHSSTLHSALFTVSLIFLDILLIFIFIFHVGWFDEKSHAHFLDWGVGHFGREQSSHKLWAQLHRQRQDLMKYSSRTPPATAGPQTCMTWKSMTTPSAERSLYHCSLRSEKIQRAVDKLVTPLTNVCWQVSRRLSVM